MKPPTGAQDSLVEKEESKTEFCTARAWSPGRQEARTDIH